MQLLTQMAVKPALNKNIKMTTVLGQTGVRSKHTSLLMADFFHFCKPTQRETVGRF